MHQNAPSQLKTWLCPKLLKLCPPWKIQVYCFLCFSPTAESFGVSAQIGSRVVRGGPVVRFHQGSTRVPPGFHEGSTRVHEVLRGLRGGASTKKSTASPTAKGCPGKKMLLGISPELIFYIVCCLNKSGHKSSEGREESREMSGEKGSEQRQRKNEERGGEKS